jgi:hypothetical protein
MIRFARPIGRSQGYVTGTYRHVGSRYTQIDDLAAGFGRVDLAGLEAEDGATIGGPLTQRTFTFDPQLPAYNLVNLRFGVSRANWDAALDVNNITDERALLSLDRERGTRARVGYLTNQPRTFGLTLGFNYRFHARTVAYMGIQPTGHRAAPGVTDAPPSAVGRGSHVTSQRSGLRRGSAPSQYNPLAMMQ